MLPELTEQDAKGQIAEIYADIRKLCGVPYVSSMQRHLATRSGWLEWAWHAVLPAFKSGVAQEAAWQAAASASAPPVPQLTPDQRAALRLGSHGASAIGSICEGFIRVSPTNLAFSGLVRQLLKGAEGGAGSTPPWRPPDALPPTPVLVDMPPSPSELGRALQVFEVEVDGHPFVPGLYRMLANWPEFMIHVAKVIGPRLVDSQTLETCAALLEAVDASVCEPLAVLPRDAHLPLPPAAEHQAVLGAIDRYRQTSPQMVVISRLIRDMVLPG
ncbi:MAG: hypothetical protein HOI95_24400 [Chromatiales bacterium]|jgi:hypothetical protein|nr:hypothetical protein [Chromatiales bacterium]